MAVRNFYNNGPWTVSSDGWLLQGIGCTMPTGLKVDVSLSNIDETTLSAPSLNVLARFDSSGLTGDLVCRTAPMELPIRKNTRIFLNGSGVGQAVMEYSIDDAFAV